MHDSFRAAAVVCAALLALGGGERVALGATDYASPGPLTHATTALDGGVAGSSGGDLVVPDGAGPFPLLVTSHGWSASAAQQVGWAEHFASWGFVVAVPTFPNALTPDADVNRQIIAQLVALYSNPATDSPAKGKVDATRIGLEGHSAGGLATTLAAATVAPGAMVLFDPVDNADAGKSAYATVCAPLLGIFADPSACNNQAEWSAFAAATTAPVTTFHVVGSTHCDGENADRGAACGAFCGGAADPTRQAVYARYATAFFLARLKGDANAAALFAPAALAADTAIASVTTAAGSACAGDAGAPVESDAGPVEAPVDGGAPSPPPAPGADPDASATPSAPGGGAAATGVSNNQTTSRGGCGCTSASGPRPLAPLFGLVVASLALLRRRRHARG